VSEELHDELLRIYKGLAHLDVQLANLSDEPAVMQCRFTVECLRQAVKVCQKRAYGIATRLDLVDCTN
jgi:hypothetical protein